MWIIAAHYEYLKRAEVELKEALRKVRESVAELEGKLKRVEAELGDGRSTKPATPGHGAGKAEPRRRTHSQRE